MRKYFLTSTELMCPYEPRHCTIIRRVSNGIRDDLALVSIDPPLGREVYNTADDVSELVLAARFKGDSIFSGDGSWSSLAVYICMGLEPDITILDYGMLTSDEAD